MLSWSLILLYMYTECIPWNMGIIMNHINNKPWVSLHCLFPHIWVFNKKEFSWKVLTWKHKRERRKRCNTHEVMRWNNSISVLIYSLVCRGMRIFYLKLHYLLEHNIVMFKHVLVRWSAFAYFYNLECLIGRDKILIYLSKTSI